jgi:hypothetical protein
VATLKRWNRGHIGAIRVAFDNDIKVGGHTAILSQSTSCCLTVRIQRTEAAAAADSGPLE